MHYNGKKTKKNLGVKCWKGCVEKQLAPFNSAVKKIKPLLQDGKCARLADLTDDEKLAVRDMFLLTMKPVLYVANIDEDSISEGTNKYVETLKKIAESESRSRCAVSCDESEWSERRQYTCRLLQCRKQSDVYKHQTG